MNKIMTASDVLAQMKAMKSAAQNNQIAKASVANPASSTTEFSNVLNNALDHVNGLQQQSAAMATKVEAGDGGVSLAQAMIASQKASIAFQATMQVRNKVVSAYQEIMNMPI